jgi:hypothetical protein
MDNCWILCQVMADMKKVYDDLIIINLYERKRETTAAHNGLRSIQFIFSKDAKMFLTKSPIVETMYFIKFLLPSKKTWTLILTELLKL